MINRPNLVNKPGGVSAPDTTSICHPFPLLGWLIKIGIQLQLQSTAVPPHHSLMSNPLTLNFAVCCKKYYCDY